MRKWPTLQDRIREKLATNTVTGCQEWTGGNNGRYGVIYDGHRSTYVHRTVWTLANGEIPAGTFVCHRCDNPKCANIDHLFLGTHLDNMADARSKHRFPVQRGEKNKHARLSEADVLKVRALAAAGVLQKRIAQRFGLHKTTVAHIVNRDSWAHI